MGFIVGNQAFSMWGEELNGEEIIKFRMFCYKLM